MIDSGRPLPVAGSDQTSGNGHLRRSLPSPLPPTAPNLAPRPYRRGWRAPWRGQWGTFVDGHCRLAKLAKKIEDELAEEYAQPSSPLRLRKLRSAARYLALVEMIAETMGIDPKATPRRMTALQARADRQLAGLAPRVIPPPSTGAELLSRISR